MAELEPNDTWQDRGIIKLTDGQYVLEVTKDGELKTEIDEDIASTTGGQQTVFSQDQETRNLLNSILKQLKVTNMHLAIMTDNVLKPSDVEV